MNPHHHSKRRKVHLSHSEMHILNGLMSKTLIPVIGVMAVSSIVLYFGLAFLMRSVSFPNYGAVPTASSCGAASFIAIYAVISIINLMLILGLSAIIMLMVVRRLVMPLMRITRELHRSVEAKKPPTITVRTTDHLLVPLVDLINKLKP